MARCHKTDYGARSRTRGARFQPVVFSSSAVTSGAEYAMHIGGSATGAQIGGLYDGGSTSGATHVTDVTAGVGGGGMPGGVPGGLIPELLDR